ncbi:uncharacterized protein LOC6565146 isoform X2 [Drosophila grimshawi]|uniref:uncharacterized protein LOC6565146 isoform X2 n=1 Tax=Drosophila grimshawi TaxID=7222 RepID=UPI000C86E4D3|nr:uncharacterized protein LOC6565146 isoform X2 [Drosophila grimshawi]
MRSHCSRKRGEMTTMPHLYDDKDVMEEFISCYRHFTPLWDSSSMAYLSKKKKAAGYQQLLKILRRVNPEASIQDVKRKINSLRCCYRREIKKIQASYDSYEPRLWWFHMMDFIKPVLNLNLIATTPPTPTPTSSRIKHERQSLDDSLDEASMHDEELFTKLFQPGDDMLVSEGDGDVEGVADADADDAGLDGEVEYETVNETRHKLDLKMESKYQQQHSTSNNHNNNNNNNNSSSSRISAGKQSRLHPYQSGQQQQQLQAQSTSLRRSIALPQMQRRRRRSSTNDGDGDVDIDIDIDEDNNNNNSSSRSSAIAAAGKKRRRQMMLMEQQSALQSEQTESECDLIGKRMAAHFRNMRPDQRLFAERIISEVLVFGRMNRLSLSARFLPNGDVGDVYAI